jgi:hypothetical protein
LSAPFEPELPQARTRLAALDEERPKLAVLGKQPYSAVAVPSGESIAFVLALTVREADLEDYVVTVRGPGRQRERSAGVRERLANVERPPVDALVQ